MLNITHNNEPDFNKYEEILNENSRVYFDSIKISKLLLADTEKLNVVERLIIRHMRLVSKETFYSFSRDSIFRFLKEHEGVHEKSLGYYSPREGFKESLDLVKVVRPLYERGIAQQFFQLYIQRSSLKSDVSRIQGMKDKFGKTELFNESGNLLEDLTFENERRDTGRYYTNNYNVQGISKRYTNCMTVPKDHFLVWFDFDQIDLRVAYHTLLKGDNVKHDEMFKLYDDKYEAMARIISEALNKEFNLEEFKKNRGHYKTGVLARCYGASKETLAQDIPDKEFVNMLDQYFVNNKRYQNYLEELEKVIDFGFDVEVVDYFGVSRVMPVTGNKATMVNKGLNTPIQSTSNSIVMNVVNSIIDKFEEYGLRDKVSSYIVRHDEPVFMVHVDAIKYLWIFEDFRNVKVDDWAVLTSGMHLGFYYDIEHKVLTEAYNIVVNDNKDNISNEAVDKEREQVYLPIKKSIGLQFGKSTEGKDYCVLPNLNKIFIGNNKEKIKEKVLGYLDSLGDYKYITIHGYHNGDFELHGTSYVKYTMIDNKDSFISLNMVNSWEYDKDSIDKDVEVIIVE